MLKRKRQAAYSLVPGSSVRLTAGELNAYTAAFSMIQPEFEELRQMQRQMESFLQAALEPSPQSPATPTGVTAEGIEWQAQSQLLQLPKSAILLCRHLVKDEFAIIQQFPADSGYAKARGQAEVLQRASDPRELVREYGNQVQHTLRFMASNLVAKAQRVAFEQFPEHNPGKVVNAISQRCRLAVGESLTVLEPMNQATRQAHGVRI
ncbi:MAG TPA: hypothetical protein VLZ12_09005 [Verrucomicrobiae bacterium]|nr:hypothetical protein [Verrucomicrobiae bacterium]